MRRKDSNDAGHMPSISEKLGLGSHIEIYGSRAIKIEGCMGVLSCDEALMRVSLKSQTLLISGAELCIDIMFGQTVYICGCISGVEFI